MRILIKHNIYTIYSRIIGILFIMLLIIVNITINNFFNEQLEKEKDLIREQIITQKKILDEGIAIIYNNVYLQRDWIEQILSSKKMNTKTQSLESKIEYNKELHISTIDQEENGLYGNIIINGNINDKTTELKNEIDSMSSFMDLMKIIQENSSFNFWTTYYSHKEYILSSPYIDASESIGDREELFNNINNSIEQVNQTGTKDIMENGWETDLFLDDTDKDVMFTKFLPVVNNDIAVGIIGNNIDISYLNKKVVHDSGVGELFIIDSVNNIVYKEKQVSSLENIDTILQSKYKINDIERVLNSEGVNLVEDYYIYKFPLENIQWQIIYLVNQKQEVFSIIKTNKMKLWAFSDCLIILVFVFLLHFLRKYQRKINEIDEQKTRFLMMVSHDLKTPLSCIIGFSERIQNRLLKSIQPLININDSKVHKEWKKINRNFEIISKEGDRLNILITNLLQMTKAQSGEIILNKEKVDIEQLINHCIESLYPLIKDKHLNIKVDIDETIGEMYVDRYYLTQLLINLLGNAINYTEVGYIKCCVKNCNEYVRFLVEDTGIGISEQDLTLIFDVFYQTNIHKQKGSGLGLAICKSIIEMHNGNIWAESVVGKGSQFYFTIPLIESKKERRKA